MLAELIVHVRASAQKRSGRSLLFRVDGFSLGFRFWVCRIVSDGFQLRSIQCSAGASLGSG